MINLFLFLAILFFVLVIISYFKIKSLKKQIQFTWKWSSPIGAFVWEDIFVFGLLFFIFSIATYFLGNPYYFVLFYCIFWLIRSVGEAQYFMLQQIVKPDFQPHNIMYQFSSLEKFFGDLNKQQSMIILQIIHQSIAVLSLIGIVLVSIKLFF